MKSWPTKARRELNFEAVVVVGTVPERLPGLVSGSTRSTVWPAMPETLLLVATVGFVVSCWLSVPQSVALYPC